MMQSRAKEPVYFDLFRRLERDILDGKFKTGDILPSEIELGEQYKVSRYSAREVYSELVRRQLVRRVRKKGTIVTYDPAATRLRKVGLILIDNVPSYYLFLQGIQDVLGERGAGLFLQYSHNDEKRHLQALEEALAHDVEGLIVSPPPMSSYESYKQMIADGFPVVVALTSNPEVHCVYPDDHKAGRLMGEHFGEMGFRRPAAIVLETLYARERMYGFREGIARSGLRLEEDHIVLTQYVDEQGQVLSDVGRLEVERLLSLDPRPDAIFAVNDSIAISIYYWLLKAGIKVPDEMAVAGVDNIGRKFHPFALTTVDIGLEKMGHAAAELLLKQLENPRLEPVRQKIEPRLIVSASTMKHVAGCSDP